LVYLVSHLSDFLAFGQIGLIRLTFEGKQDNSNLLPRMSEVFWFIVWFIVFLLFLIVWFIVFLFGQSAYQTRLFDKNFSPDASPALIG